MKFDKKTIRAVQELAKDLTAESRLLSDVDIQGFLSAVETRVLPVKVPELPAHSGPKLLFDFQVELKAKIERELKGEQAVLATLPTGAGKTFTAVSTALDLLKENFRQILWLAPQLLLLEQARSELNKSWWWQERSFSLAIDELNVDGSRQFGFATIQSQTRTSPDHHGEKTLVVLDEAHHIESNAFGWAIKRFKTGGCKILGLTATPWRKNESEQHALHSLFDGNLIWPTSLGERPIESLQSRGVYADFKVTEITAPVGSVGRMLSRRRFGVRAGEASMDSSRIEAVVERIEGTEKRVLIFCYTLAQCAVITATLQSKGIQAEMVSGQFEIAWNRDVLSRFEEGIINVIVSAKYIATGVDLPSAELCILMTPISTASTYEQIVGRIARGPAVGGTVSAEIWEFDNNFERFGGLQSYGRALDGWR